MGIHEREGEQSHPQKEGMFLKIRIYLFSESGEGRLKERERQSSMSENTDRLHLAWVSQ